MRGGAENRKKTIIAGTLGTIAVLAFGYQVWGLLGPGSTPTPPPSITAPAPTQSERPPVDSLVANSGSTNSNAPTVAMAGVNAAKLSTSANGLDPTLDEAAMLRTESLIYSGSGRNIFSANYVPVATKLPGNVPSARPLKAIPVVPTGPPPPPPTCPPTCPPIPLRFFGTEHSPGGHMQGFFLNGSDVYMAAEGEIVARKYKILTITPNSARVEDLTNTFEQTLVLQN